MSTDPFIPSIYIHTLSLPYLYSIYTLQIYIYIYTKWVMVSSSQTVFHNGYLFPAGTLVAIETRVSLGSWEARVYISPWMWWTDMTSLESICTLEPPTPDIFKSIDHKGCESSNPEAFHAQAQKPGKLAVFKLFSPMGTIHQLVYPHELLPSRLQVGKTWKKHPVNCWHMLTMFQGVPIARGEPTIHITLW